MDRKRNQAVRVDVVTGVLPKDKELGRLRGRVINHKRAASGREHRRFFDRLGELIVEYVRTGDENFTFSRPVPLNWEEYRSKLAFSPASSRSFVHYLVSQGISPDLADGLIELGILDSKRDADALLALRTKACSGSAQTTVFDPDQLYAGTLTERVNRVVQTIIEPVLANDGGRLHVVDIDAAKGELHIRFVGSCANCPYSLLSMEQIVKPTLLAIPGVNNVVHRAAARTQELEYQRSRQQAARSTE